MYKDGPVDYPACSTSCDPNFTNNGGQCLTKLEFVEGALNTRFSTHGHLDTKVRFLISKMKPNKENEHLGVGGTSHRERRIFLENRDVWYTSNVESYSGLVILNDICQTLDNNGPVTGFDLNSVGDISSNNTMWYLNRYWITIYEDDWWIANKKEIHPRGHTYTNLNHTHKIRATASTDTYYNGIIVLDTYGCQSGGCDEFFLDDGRPGVFKVKVGI